MAEKLNKCAVCGKEYKVCPTCAKIKSFTSWRTITDTINCYRIYMALSDYTNKYSTKAETKKILSECDLSDLEKFNENIKTSIKEIMGKPKLKKTKLSKEKSSETKDIQVSNGDSCKDNENNE